MCSFVWCGVCVCVCVCTRARVHTHTHACMNVCVCVYVYLDIHRVCIKKAQDIPLMHTSDKKTSHPHECICILEASIHAREGQRVLSTFTVRRAGARMIGMCQRWKPRGSKDDRQVCLTKRMGPGGNSHPHQGNLHSRDNKLLFFVSFSFFLFVLVFCLLWFKQCLFTFVEIWTIKIIE